MFSDSRLVFFLFDAIGLLFFFNKCGEKAWWALVPVVRFYKLSQCTHKEET